MRAGCWQDKHPHYAKMGDGLKFIALPFLGLAALWTAPAIAQDSPDGWIVQISPYLWATGLDGDVSPFRSGPTVSIEKDFSEVMDSLNLGGFINFWARNGRFVLSGDMMFVDTTDSKAGTLPALPGLPAGLPVSGDVDTTQFMATVQGGYRFHDAPGLTVDGLAGLRFWHISNELTVRALGQSRGFKESFSWVDPVIGMRALARISERWSFQAQADVGGFGMGSDQTWSALGTFNYIITDNGSVSFGYKIMDVDYDDDGHVFDARLQGPVIGATWRF
ncbi:hypothetical protein RM190_05730 [Paracoccus sp. CPCC 101403]|uniref:Outer membrane protein beta-barrel domain-containing protein n=1 Tax=Paracoccus broussonetiae TaxID=3075834 RepID=A0ABU3EAV4_9RHOB|nr:hypothetical protein [Paracoccus sp. CPCC 101403]MDT1061353.1 hypothetical protein [Paracoccus sp. CPCC 101403]